MKTSIFTKILALLVISGTAWSCSQNQYAKSSEYDDTYFTASDRTTVLPAENTVVVKQDDKKYQYEEDSYSARTVNPDYVSKYNTGEVENIESSEEEYFVEGYNAYDDYKQSRRNVYNYNNTPYDRFGTYSNFSSPFNNPFNNAFNSPFNHGFSNYYDPFFYDNRGFLRRGRFGNRGWRSGLNLSFNWGSPYSRYGGYSSYYDYYDPFYCPPSYASFYGGGSRFYPSRFGNGFSNRYYSGTFSNFENRSGRNIVRGGRIGRSNIANNSNRSNNAIIKNTKGSANRNSTIRSNRSGVTPRSSTRSRSAVRTTENELNRRSSAVRRSTSTTNSRRATPTTRTRRTYDSNRAAPVKRSYSSEGRNSRSYSPRSNSNTPSRRSYSTPSRSRSTPSRSGSSYKSSSSSRSSSPSRSYSSGSSSKSSSSSSRSSSRSSSSRSSRSKR